VRRIDLDVRVARAAQRAGADLKEGFEVGTDVTFDKEKGLWTIKSTDVSVVAAVAGRQLVVLGWQPAGLRWQYHPSWS
jgi:hypothetical protein